MKDKPVIIAAAIIAFSILVLAYVLSRVAVEIASARQESSDLVQWLEKLSSEVPRLADEAGDHAGRSAVKGAVDEAIVEPLGRLAAVAKPSRRPNSKAPGTTEEENAVGLSEADGFPHAPVIHVEFVEPSVSIEISTDLEPSALIPVRSRDKSESLKNSADQPEPSNEARAKASLVERHEN
jgi:hypothetical protein